MLIAGPLTYAIREEHLAGIHFHEFTFYVITAPAGCYRFLLGLYFSLLHFMRLKRH